MTNSEAETEAAAERLARRLPGGSLVLLFGELGAGKTRFVRGLAAGCGVDPDEVTSPTFTLVQSYRGSRVLHHVDLYRLTAAEADELGLEEMAADRNAVVAIEWAERLPRAVPGAIEVRIDDLGGDRRRILIDP
ncbi:MAG: tRNA (adenosine(37)-N6)-threonylcarbamoyltransferase complex ATPase subunit type 1 TsaE [Vicinamibacterales bacterium]